MWAVPHGWQMPSQRKKTLTASVSLSERFHFGFVSLSCMKSLLLCFQFVLDIGGCMIFSRDVPPSLSPFSKPGCQYTDGPFSCTLPSFRKSRCLIRELQRYSSSNVWCAVCVYMTTEIFFLIKELNSNLWYSLNKSRGHFWQAEMGSHRK